MERVEFLNYPVDSLDISDALAWMDASIRARTPRYITVVNANKLWQVTRNPRLSNFIRNSDLVLPEWAIYWGAGMVRKPLKNYVCGIELLKASLPWAAKKGHRIYFLGARQATIDALKLKLSEDFPNLMVAGAHNGYFQSDQEQNDVIWEIKVSQPDILFVAMGSPRQEYWIEENLHKVEVPIAMGVGGSFDVIAGIKSDTPNWARGHGIEWLYRLSQDPKSYWKRYLITNPWFVWQVVKERARQTS